MPKAPSSPIRLHIGSGRARLEGWLNVDIQPLPGVDVVADVTQGLRYTGVEAIFAEHFLEHLALDDAIAFLLESHRALADGGWLRLSTPNLDWVWATHYRLAADTETKVKDALVLNRAFHGWRHRFLWNREILGSALAACGFPEPRWCRYGESREPVFAGIERHETYGDSPDLPHVIIAEVRKGRPAPERLTGLRQLLHREFLAHRAD